MEDTVWIDSDDAPESQGEYSIYLENLALQMNEDLDKIDALVLRIEENSAPPPKSAPPPNTVSRYVINNDGKRYEYEIRCKT